MAKENNILINDQPVFYRIEGEGQPLVLIHGFAEDGTVWENQIEYFKSKYRLIIPDLPGSGKSIVSEQMAVGNVQVIGGSQTGGGWEDYHNQWSMEYFAECIAGILDRENIAETIMIGHSMGGYVTLAFADKYANRLKAFSLFHSSAYADSEEKIEARRRGIEFIKQYGPVKFLEQSIPNLFSEEFKKKDPATVQKILTRFTNFTAQSLVNYYEAMILRPDRTHVLKNFPRPIQFILGKYDTAVPFELGLQQCYMPGLSYIHILEHTAHMGMWEEPSRSNVFIDNFLLHGKIG
jgi:pimeloyl-ACP methyl ester carboxylesterase